jgi:hypothetical protein
MALTLKVEQRLEDVGLIKFFGEDRDTWRGLAKQAYQFVKGNFPEGSTIRPDDVAKALFPLIEVDEDLRDKLHEYKLKQKYWISDFTDLIIDRTWTEITTEHGNDKKGRSSKKS